MPRTNIFKRNPEAISDFLNGIKLGMSIKSACEYAGISEEVFYYWQRKADEEESAGRPGKHCEFIRKYKKARATFQARHLSRITQASDDGTWQASAWLLERRIPDEYGQRSNVSLDDSKITVVSDVPKEGPDEDKR